MILYFHINTIIFLLVTFYIKYQFHTYFTNHPSSQLIAVIKKKLSSRIITDTALNPPNYKQRIEQPVMFLFMRLSCLMCMYDEIFSVHFQCPSSHLCYEASASVEVYGCKKRTFR